MSYRLEKFLNEIRPVALRCGVHNKEMEGLARLLMREPEPKPELTTEEKVALMADKISSMGMSVQDFIDCFKAEPEQPIIKRSGETWVCRFNGVDYFCNDPISCNGKSRSLEMEFEKMPQIWETIKGLEITDEIAKLRPMVIPDGIEYPDKLVSVENNIRFKYSVIEPMGSINRFISVRLATVEDL